MTIKAQAQSSSYYFCPACEAVRDEPHATDCPHHGMEPKAAFYYIPAELFGPSTSTTLSHLDPDQPWPYTGYPAKQ